MIISFNGDHGSGKSTIAKRVAEKLGYERVYMGQIFRDLAKKKGYTLVEYSELGKKDPTVDKEVDDYIIKLSQEKDNFVIESRTAWHFILDSLKVFLKVEEVEGSKRMLKNLKEENSENRKNEDKEIETVDDVVMSNRKRRLADKERYRMYYGIDGDDMSNYDFVLDTTNLGIDEVFEKVMDFVNKNKG